ncbi:hypothetical protein GCM10009682_29090 [Luedemannella flava]|uniref:N-acetyltransferase domain-containing protein n=1 Tax=Luedemannella flava TaxID=349316 RepID=A0ABN2M0L7_9ACTN
MLYRPTVTEEAEGSGMESQARARRATVADLPEVVRLVSVMFADLGTATDASWAARTGRVLAGRLWVDVGVLVVDAPTTGLAACAVGALHHGLPSPRRRTETTGYVEWVVTDPAWRRRGHALSVTAALVDWLVDEGAAVIDVHASVAAAPLYRRLGFTGDGPVALRRRTAS